jgi:hypothetical protein
MSTQMTVQKEIVDCHHSRRVGGSSEELYNYIHHYSGPATGSQSSVLGQPVIRVRLFMLLIEWPASFAGC